MSLKLVSELRQIFFFFYLFWEPKCFLLSNWGKQATNFAVALSSFIFAVQIDLYQFIYGYLFVKYEATADR